MKNIDFSLSFRIFVVLFPILGAIIFFAILGMGRNTVEMHDKIYSMEISDTIVGYGTLAEHAYMHSGSGVKTFLLKENNEIELSYLDPYDLQEKISIGDHLSKNPSSEVIYICSPTENFAVELRDLKKMRKLMAMINGIGIIVVYIIGGLSILFKKMK